MPVTDNNIITAPVGIGDVRQVLGAASTDLGSLCTHPNVNPWAKWKPAPLRNAVAMPDALDGTDGWKGNPVAETGRPWWFGGGGGVHATYTIPVISQLSDIGADGVQKDTARWQYNAPAGGLSEPFRLTDFVGYRHDARTPVWPAMPRIDALDLNSSVTFAVGFLDYAEHGEFSIDDVRDMLGLNDSEQLRAAMAVVHTVGSSRITSVFVKSQPLSDDTATTQFHARPTSSGGYEIDGRAMTIEAGDDVDVYLFLTTGEDGEALDNITKYSLVLEPGHVAYRRLRAERAAVLLYGTYKWTQPEFSPVARTGYCQIGDNEYRYNKVLTAWNSAVTANIPSHASIGTAAEMVIYVTVDCVAAGYPLSFQTELYRVRTGAGEHTVNFNDIVLDNPPQFTSYPTLDDLRARTNGTVVQGIPVPDRVEYYADNDDVPSGTAITSRTAGFYVRYNTYASGVSVYLNKESGEEVEV